MLFAPAALLVANPPLGAKRVTLDRRSRTARSTANVTRAGSDRSKRNASPARAACAARAVADRRPEQDQPSRDKTRALRGARQRGHGRGHGRRCQLRPSRPGPRDQRDHRVGQTTWVAGVAFEASIAGNEEHASIDGGGRVRSIHRYHEPATWPFIAGVPASLVPVSSSFGYLEPVPDAGRTARQLVPGGAPAGTSPSMARRGLDDAERTARRDGALRDRGGEPRAGDGRTSTLLVGARPLDCTERPDPRTGPSFIPASASARVRPSSARRSSARRRGSSGVVVAHAIVVALAGPGGLHAARSRVVQRPRRPSLSVAASPIGRDWNDLSFLPDTTSAVKGGRGCAPTTGISRGSGRFDVVAACLGLGSLAPLPGRRGPSGRVPRAHLLSRRTGGLARTAVQLRVPNDGGGRARRATPSEGPGQARRSSFQALHQDRGSRAWVDTPFSEHRRCRNCSTCSAAT